ncbi:MAG: 1-deoxy-D-xylulose-5-phosphate reductoisomerase [Bacillota bacterium]
MKSIGLLGSTGSIGTQTLEIVRHNREHFRVSSITAHSNAELLAKQIEEFEPELAVIFDESKYMDLKERVKGKTKLYTGLEGLMAAAAIESADVVVSSIVGIAGLIPTFHAIQNGKTIALANKETLVTAGRLIMKYARDKSIEILPVDSEHSAIFQSIGANKREQIRKLILTASGGPFRLKSCEELQKVTLEDALKHPNWSMGSKITIDSATLMNKGLEIIEARWLFDILPDRIDVVVHPQSIIHSMVEFIDGAVMAQLGLPDMKVPIQYALTYPDRIPIDDKKLDLVELSRLEFFKPDTDKFPCLKLAYDALKAGDSACIVLNGANEAAVKLFMEKKIRFMEIPELIYNTLNEHNTVEIANIEDVTETDKWARNEVNRIFEMRCRM